jgi:hypothetical protein
MKHKKVALIAGMISLPLIAHASWESDQYKSLGTAFRYVSGTDITVISGTTVSASALATSDTSVFRVSCDQQTRFTTVSIGSSANIVSPSGLKIEPNTPEYFPVDANTVPALKPVNSTGLCNISRMKK